MSGLTGRRHPPFSLRQFKKIMDRIELPLQRGRLNALEPLISILGKILCSDL